MHDLSLRGRGTFSSPPAEQRLNIVETALGLDFTKAETEDAARYRRDDEIEGEVDNQESSSEDQEMI